MATQSGFEDCMSKMVSQAEAAICLGQKKVDACIKTDHFMNGNSDFLRGFGQFETPRVFSKLAGFKFVVLKSA